MNNPSPTNRRTFLKQSALASGVFIVPRHVLGGVGYTAPSDQLNVGAVGAGGKGWVNLTNTHKSGEARIAFLCDVDNRQAQKARDEHPKAVYYTDYRTLLDKEKDNIDAVIVSTPDHMHAIIALAAMELGKHVYVEKPLTHSIAEARQLTEAAERYQVVTQMGNQGSSGDDTRRIEAWVQQGVLGDVHTVYTWTNRPVWPQGVPLPQEAQPVPEGVDWELWLGVAPQRAYHEAFMPFRWRGWWDYGTGALGDMGCHIMDVPYRALQLGYPESVYCSVGSVYANFFEQAYYPESCPPSSVVHLKFPARGSMPAVNFSWSDGGIQPPRPEGLDPNRAMGDNDGGMRLVGAKGELIAGMWGREPYLLSPEGKEMDAPAVDISPVKDGPDGHQAQWVRACKEGYGATTSSPFSIAGPLTETVIMGNLAVRSHSYREATADGKGHAFPGRKKLLWDGKNMKITNFDPANAFVSRKYRTGW